jgi:hypothetical protein
MGVHLIGVHFVSVHLLPACTLQACVPSARLRAWVFRPHPTILTPIFESTCGQNSLESTPYLPQSHPEWCSNTRQTKVGYHKANLPLLRSGSDCLDKRLTVAQSLVEELLRRQTLLPKDEFNDCKNRPLIARLRTVLLKNPSNQS